MVASTKNQDEFSRPVLDFGDPKLRILLLEGIGVDQGGFVPQMLIAFAKMFRKVVFSFFF